jgi:hypothetical protein
MSKVSAMIVKIMREGYAANQISEINEYEANK